MFSHRSLAILSCALALLATVPSITHGAEASRSNGTPTHAVAEGYDASFRQVDNSESPTRRRAAIANARSRTSVRQLHILATLEIIRRLVASELQPRQGSVDVNDFSHAVEVVAFETPIAAPIPITTLPPAPQAERQFVIHHCLLAPPAISVLV